MIFERRKQALSFSSRGLELTFADVSYADVRGLVREIKDAALRVDTAFHLPQSPEAVPLQQLL